MRFPLLLASAAVFACASLTASAAEGSIWVEGRWENTGGQYQWRQGYWQTTTVHTTTTTSAPAQQWVDGHWAQGANGMVWVEGHYQAVPAPIVVSAPTPPPVVVVEEPRPQTTVVIGAGYGYDSGYGYNSGYGYHSGYSYHRPVCPPVYCPPVRPVVHCPPVRPVVHAHVHVPPLRVQLPRPSIAMVKVGGKIKLPVPVFERR